MGSIGIASDLMGHHQIVFWTHNIYLDDFHWGRMLADGTWAEKRGSSGIYIWENERAMCRDAYRIGYRGKFRGSFNEL